MSVQFCDNCSRLIDLDVNVEHFDECGKEECNVMSDIKCQHEEWDDYFERCECGVTLETLPPQVQKEYQRYLENDCRVCGRELLGSSETELGVCNACESLANVTGREE